MTRALAIHIADQVDGKRFTTLCGRAGIPEMGESFADGRSLIGRVPGSAGCGIHAIRPADISVDQFKRLCQHCFNRWI